jgi:hypothetical protein
MNVSRKSIIFLGGQIKMFNVILAAITLRLITNAPDNCFSDTTYIIKGENPIYHVGDTFERVIDVVYQEYIDYEDENGEFHSEIESETITDKLTDSLDGYTFIYAGQYTETLNGDAGIFRQIVNVYDYGDMNGDLTYERKEGDVGVPSLYVAGAPSSRILRFKLLKEASNRTSNLCVNAISELNRIFRRFISLYLRTLLAST